MRRFNQSQCSEKAKLRPGAYAILTAGDKLLLTHQDEPFSEFQIPGGGIDPSEGKIQALHREVLEETGWRIHQPTFLTAYRRTTFMPEYDIWAEKVCNIFVARAVGEVCKPLEKDHCAVLVPIEEGIELLSNPIDAQILARHFGV